MRLDHLKKKRKEAKNKVKRLNHRCHFVTSLLCKVRGEYLEAKDEFESLDREIAEHYVQVQPSKLDAKSKTKTKAKTRTSDSDSLNLNKLTSEQIHLLKARLEKELEEQEKEKEEEQ